MIEYLALITAAILWSLNPALIARFKDVIKPITFVGLRALAAIPFYVLTGIDNLPRESLTLLIIFTSALLGPGLGDIAYTKSIQLIGGSLAVVISYTYIFVAQMLAMLVLREGLEVTVVVSGLIALTGIAIASGANYGKNDLRKGVALAAVASIAWASAITLLKIALGRASVSAVMLFRLIFVLTTFLPAGIFAEGLPNKHSLKYLIFAAVTTSIFDLVVGMYLFAYSISILGIATSVVPTALTPILTLITTKALSHEEISVRYVVGALLVSMAIVLTFF